MLGPIPLLAFGTSQQMGINLPMVNLKFYGEKKEAHPGKVFKTSGVSINEYILWS